MIRTALDSPGPTPRGLSSDAAVPSDRAVTPAGGPFHAPAKYQLLRVVGSGAMGTVVLARDRTLGRLVALKFLRETCTTFLRRFEREARLMARLVHPAIVPIYELDRFEGRTYIAMDYVRGGNLELLRLDPRELVTTVRGVVDALAFTHREGIVHRDVKPENILVDARGRARLTDFGLALDPGEGAARADDRAVVGTPLTMSPEQVRGEPVGPASDVFSLGATLHRKLTGQWPFRGRGVADVLRAVQFCEPAPIRSVERELPRELESIVLRCLEKEPGDRYRSMEELGRALDRFLERPPVLTRAWRLLSGRRTRPAFTGPRIHPQELS